MTGSHYLQPYRRNRTNRPRSSRRLEQLWRRVPQVSVRWHRPTRREVLILAGTLATTIVTFPMLMQATAPPSIARAQDSAPPSTIEAVSESTLPTPALVATPTTNLTEPWRVEPHAYQIRPPAPGQIIRDVTFLADGRLAIRVQVGKTYQMWLQEPVSGERTRVATCNTPCALKPDGTATALGGNFEGETLIDMSVSPSGARALLVTTGTLNGFQVAWLRWVDEDGIGEPQELGLVPIAGSIVWRPDEQAAALIVHSVPTTAVMQIGRTVDEAIYIGDSSIDGTAGAPVAPMSWSSDFSRHVFGGVQGTLDPNSTSPLALFTPSASTAFGLLIGDNTGIPPVSFGAGGMSPYWLPDGRLLAVGNVQHDLVLRVIDADGTVTPLAKLGIQAMTPTSYAARWDVARHRLLILQNRTDMIGARDAYLVSYP